RRAAGPLALRRSTLLDDGPARRLAACRQGVQTQFGTDASSQHDPLDLPRLLVEDLAADRRGLPGQQPIGPGSRMLGVPEPHSADMRVSSGTVPPPIGALP